MHIVKALRAVAALLAIAVPAVAQGAPTVLDRPGGAAAGTHANQLQFNQIPDAQLQRSVYVAIERALYTLPSHADRWRTAYFIKYTYMPNGEMPTVNEGFVYHAARFLIAEIGLTDQQRQQILDAVYPN